MFVLQVASLFASYILGYLSAAKMQSILVTHMVQLLLLLLLQSSQFSTQWGGNYDT